MSCFLNKNSPTLILNFTATKNMQDYHRFRNRIYNHKGNHQTTQSQAMIKPDAKLLT